MRLWLLPSLSDLLVTFSLLPSYCVPPSCSVTDVIVTGVSTGLGVWPGKIGSDVTASLSMFKSEVVVRSGVVAVVGVVSLGGVIVVTGEAVVSLPSPARWWLVAMVPSVMAASLEMLISSTDFVPLSFSFSFSLSLSLSLSLASRRGRMRSAIEVLLTFTPSPPPPSPPPALAGRLARALLKAKKSPNFFLMVLEGNAVVVDVTDEVTEGGAGAGEDEG